MKAEAALQRATEHFTVSEIAKELKVSTDTVMRIFATEPGVLRITTFHSKQRPRIRIPLDVKERVYSRMQNPGN